MVSLVKLCEQQGIDKTYWIAYSGGLDSHVLLHAMSSVRNYLPIQIKAIHVHHGLSPHADHWALHCANVCAELNIDFVMEKITIDVPKGKSLEDFARNKRYKIFEKLLSPGDLLLTAHHQNDQAETVLLQLLRGAGPKGLAAMPPVKKIGQGQHLRPLLNFTRQELQIYAENHQLHWIEDESNAKTQFTRNYIRHEVMPLLETRWPTAVEVLARTASTCADVQSVVSEIVHQDLMQAKNLQGLSVEYLKKLSHSRQRLVLREWISSEGYVLPSAKKLNHVLSDVLLARHDKLPVVSWGNVELRRFKNNLYLKKISANVKKIPDPILWNLNSPCLIPNVGTLTAVRVKGQGLRGDLKQVMVQFRRGGERCQLSGRNFHHDLKNLFQTWGVPPWERDGVPIIYVENKIAAIVGYVVCEGFEANPEADGYLIKKLQTEPRNGAARGSKRARP